MIENGHGGGRMMADFTERVYAPSTPGTFDVGTKMRMVFRVREYDKARGFRKYFWKATPAGTG